MRRHYLLAALLLLLSSLMWVQDLFDRNLTSEGIRAALDAGADATAKDEWGKTAWDLIQDNEALKGSKAYWRLNDLRF